MGEWQKHRTGGSDAIRGDSVSRLTLHACPVPSRALVNDGSTKASTIPDCFIQFGRSVLCPCSTDKWPSCSRSAQHCANTAG